MGMGGLSRLVCARLVLLRVEHLEQRGRRVAVERVAPELVDLVEHDDGVVRAALLHRLEDEPRQRADVGAAVAAHLRLGVDAAERDAVEVASERRRDALAERGLADARRAEHAHDRALCVAAQLAHRERLQDATLDLAHRIVVVVELRARRRHAQPLRRRLVPRQVGNPLQVVDQRRVPAKEHARTRSGLRRVRRTTMRNSVRSAGRAH
eukprot:1672233-Pleurochrysis_carterae.AAC.1